MLKKLIGSKQFYKNVFFITLPIMLQQILINIVSLADNLMVGQLSEEIISGIYIASKILFVINMAIFGAVEGSSIFFAQYVGSQDEKHIKQCFNFKVYADLLVSLISIIILVFFGTNIARLFVAENEAIIAGNYLKYYSICLIPFAISNILGTSFREIHKSFVPMLGSLLALGVNIGLNYLFIFRLNLSYFGAVIATIIARFLEMSFILIFTLITKPIFASNIFKNFKIEKKLFSNILIRSLPLFLNEIFWVGGQTMLIFAYTKVSLIASPALSISQVLFDFFYMAAIALGDGIAVIMGNTLGENNLKEARKQIGYFIFLTIIISVIMSGFLALVGPHFAKIYKVSPEAFDLAINLIYFNAILMPLLSLNTAIFFIIRSGGVTFLVFIFDSIFAWFIQVPISLLLAYKTNLSLPVLFLCVNLLELIKLILGSILLKTNIWLKNLTIDRTKNVEKVL